jgi:hypothetical protein
MKHYFESLGERVIRMVWGLPGQKIVSLTPGNVFSIMEDGYVGPPGQLDLFRAQIESGGLVTVIIQRLLPDTYIREHDGRVLPWRVVYGLRINGGKIEFLSADEMRQCYATADAPREPVPSEDGVLFSGLADTMGPFREHPGLAMLLEPASPRPKRSKKKPGGRP